MQNIYKLPFGVPRGVKASEVSALESIVTSFYREVKRYESSIMACKGGHYERDLLASLAIPAVNLENFGCPKAGELFDELIWLEVNRHCPKVEFEAHARWIENMQENETNFIEL